MNTVKRAIRKDLLVFGSPLIGKAEIDEVNRTLLSGWLSTGPKVAAFEESFRRYKNARFAAAVSSGTAALELSLIAAELQPGDEVVTTALTFCATVNAIIHAGLKPVLADVDPNTMNICPEELERRITPRTRAMLLVHFAGRPCEMDALMDIARRHRLKIVEDCAHAIESRYKGLASGTFGDFGCFSFYVTKNLTTGEGGMVLTRRKANASRIRRMALHGLSQDAWKRFNQKEYRHYYVQECGYKYNMTDLAAAIGKHQLKRIEQNWKRRAEIWRQYDASFEDLPLVTPSRAAPGTRHAYHLYTILVDERRCGLSRDRFLDAMVKHNIGVGVHYLSIPEHPYYRREFGWRPHDYPHAMRIGRQTVSLPLSPKLSAQDVQDVVAAVGDILQRTASGSRRPPRGALTTKTPSRPRGGLR
ncbi:MAG: DegT/DnrJ/EryC1/StrS family aminotransferase [Acidobacteria bacterium]|nr:DegT/DnrJ/EryC1/StrS family aminotransferase [Acidobacteriota bacterium]